MNLRAPNFFRSRRRLQDGMTILEVTFALAAFSLAAAGFTMSYQNLNTRAARVRCDTVANAILRAKIGKVLTDPWIPTPPGSNIVTTPVDCVLTMNNGTPGQIQTTADPNDPYDVGPTVTLLSSSDFPSVGVVTGTLYRNTYAFESAAKTVVIDYQLTYTFRGTTYNCYASTIRAADK